MAAELFLREFYRGLNRTIRRQKTSGQEGTVVLKIQILENGRPGHVSVYRSSGWDLLDAAAVNVLTMAGLFRRENVNLVRLIMCYTTMPGGIPVKVVTVARVLSTAG